MDLEVYKNHLLKGSYDQDPVRMRTVLNYLSTVKNNEFLVPRNASKDEIIKVNAALKSKTRHIGVVIRSITKHLYGFDVSKLIKPSKRKRANKERVISDEQTIKQKSLLDKEVDLLVNDSSVNLYSRVYISLAFDAGGRGSEILNLKYKDFCFDYDRDISGYPLKLKESKGQSDVIKRGKPRDVCVSKRTMNLLKQQMVDLGVSEKSSEKVFSEFYRRNVDSLDSKDRAIERSNVIKRLNQELGDISQEILGKRITSHWLRHSTLTSMALKGVDLLGIKEYAGHIDPKTTLLYIKASGQLSRKAFKDWRGEK